MAIQPWSLTPLTAATAGTVYTPVDAGNTNREVLSLTVQADTSNTGIDEVGGVGLIAGAGGEIGPGDTVEIVPPTVRGVSESFMLEDVKIIAASNGNKFRFIAWRKK